MADLRDRSERPILVGVDESPGTRPTVQWAARRAAATGERLRLVHVSAPLGLAPGVPTAADLPPGVVLPGYPGPVDQDLQDRAERALLESAADIVGGVGPGTEVSAERLIGPVGATLVAASADASLVVLGSREHGAVADVVLGSVSRYVSSHAACPTVVVHGRDAADRRKLDAGSDVTGWLAGWVGAAAASGLTIDTAGVRIGHGLAVLAPRPVRHTPGDSAAERARHAR